MEYLQGYVYHIKDDYFNIVNDDKLMVNKERGQYRPTYYCEKDSSSGIIWVVPMSTRYEKFEREYNKKIEKYGRCNTIVLGNYDGKKAAFLIQNMFPITEKYLDHIHTRNGNPVPVSNKLKEEIGKRVKEVRALMKRGYKITFPDIMRLEKVMLSELTNDKEMERNSQSLADKIKSAQQKADKANQETAAKNIQPKRNKGQEL